MATRVRGAALVVSLATALVINGCAADSITLSKAESIPPGEGVVFGRVKVIWNGEERKSSSDDVLGQKGWTVTLLADGASTAKELRLGDDGSFTWHLPPGGYVIAAFHGIPPLPLMSFLIGGSDLPQISGRIFAHFVVAGDAAHYIGTLTLAFDAHAAYRMVVEDDYDRAQPEFAGRFPTAATAIGKELMVMEAQR